MKFKNLTYKLKKIITPYKMAIITVVISVVASVCVSLVSSVGKDVISSEMDAIGLNGLSAIMYSNTAENVTDTEFYTDILNIQNIKKVTPVLYDYATVKFVNNKTATTMGWGISADAQDIVSLNITNGRMFNNTDITSNSFVCLIDEDLAVDAYKRSNICGKTITVTIGKNTCKFKVIGTVKKGSSVLNNMSSDVLPSFIYIPHTTMKNLSTKSSFDQVMFITDKPEQVEEKFSSNLNMTNPKYKNYTVKLTNLTQHKGQVLKIVDTAFLSLFLVSCVAILICSISVGASVNTAVSMRQKDIGIKMSLGASRINIIAEFLFSAVFSCVVGIVIASVSVFLMLNIAMLFLELTITFDYSLIILSIFATILLTTVFSLFPSYKAANLQPIKALSRE